MKRKQVFFNVVIFLIIFYIAISLLRFSLNHPEMNEATVFFKHFLDAVLWR